MDSFGENDGKLDQLAEEIAADPCALSCLLP
jgi:hypothetical protein